VNLSVADWNGLVGANVTLEQLRLQAGVGTIDQLLNTARCRSRISMRCC
jgi:hypothetical protein